MKNITSKFYVVAAFLCSAAIMFAQPGETADGDALEGADNQAPIGDYLWVLAIVGILYVYTRYKSTNYQSQKTINR